VHTSVGLPSGGYAGLIIDLVFEARTAHNSICEEPHVFLEMPFDRGSAPSLELRLSFNGGQVVGHTLKQIRQVGRYKSLSETPASADAFLEACRSLATDTNDWKQAENASEFSSEQWRQRELVEAVQALPLLSISCTGIDGMSCNYGRDELLALFQETPPDRSEQIFVPGEGPLYVYNYSEPNVLVGTDYSVTMSPAYRDQPATIRIRFERNGRPVI